MKDAASKPNIAVITDWTRWKSWEYMAVQEESKLSILYVMFPPSPIKLPYDIMITKASLQFSCVDSILINGKGSVYCPGEDFLVNVTSLYMKYALYPTHVNDKG
jgi:hypothetical protein